MGRLAHYSSADSPHKFKPSQNGNPFGHSHLASLPATPRAAYTQDQRSSWSGSDKCPETLLSLKRESTDTMDEKQWHQTPSQERQHTSRDQEQNPRDPEKATPTGLHTSQSSSPPADVASLASSNQSINDIQAQQAQHALRILLFLSGPCIALSFVNLIWTFLALLVAMLCMPLRLCTILSPFRNQVCHFLAPTLGLQLHCIYSPALPRPSNENDSYSASGLVLVHVAAPLLSIGVAVAAWVVAVYWGLASIVGDPAGSDGRDDGKEAVLGLRGWWERLLHNGARHL